MKKSNPATRLQNTLKKQTLTLEVFFSKLAKLKCGSVLLRVRKTMADLQTRVGGLLKYIFENDMDMGKREGIERPGYSYPG